MSKLGKVHLEEFSENETSEEIVEEYLELEEDDGNISAESDNLLPPTKKRKVSKKKSNDSSFKKYSKEILIIAAEAVKAGASLHQTSKAYNIPFSTVRRFTLGGENAELIPDYEFMPEDNLTDNENLQDDSSIAYENIVLVKEEVVYEDDQQGEDLRSFCFACLEQPSDVFSLQESQLKFCETFLQDEIVGLNTEDLRLCKKCLKSVKTIQKFKIQCSNSLEVLKTKYEEVKKFVNVKSDEELTEDENKEAIAEDHNYESSSLISMETKPTSIPNVEKLATKSVKVTTWFCSVCSHFFPDLLENHYAHFHGIEQNGCWTCKCCSMEVDDKNSFLKHFDSDHIRFSEPQKCAHCEATFEYREPFKMHVSTHNAEYSCDFCHKRFYQVRIMRKHVEVTHLGLKHCNLCRRAFATEEDYEKHMEEELEIRKKFTCEHCEKSFIDRQSLRKHQSASKCNTERIPCEMCGATFVSMYALTYHKKAKHQELQHLCTYCGSKFVLPKELAHHIAETHEAGKHDPFPCEICGKVYSSSRILNGHMKSVHSEDKYNCNLCDAKFKQIHTWQRHQFTHTKQRPYGCHLCPTGYYRTDYLRGHYESAHQLSLTAKEIIKICRRKRITADGEVIEVENNK